MVVTFVGGCRCAMSSCDLDLTFNLSKVTLSLIMLSRLYLRNCKAKEVESLQGH